MTVAVRKWVCPLGLQVDRGALIVLPELFLELEPMLLGPVKGRFMLLHPRVVAVGENSSEIREAVCASFGFLGLKLDPDANAQLPADRDIARPESAVRVLIVQAREEWAIARECLRLATLEPAA